MQELRTEPLTAEAFAPYGDVIESATAAAEEMNAESFLRFDDLCNIEAQEGRVAISIARCQQVTNLPYQFEMVERHPHGSQAFVPLTPCKMIVVVAPAGRAPTAEELRAFVSNGRQGINYHRGTWHMPLIAFEAGQEFLIVDRVGDSPNCDLHYLDESIRLLDGA